MFRNFLMNLFKIFENFLKIILNFQWPQFVKIAEFAKIGKHLPVSCGLSWETTLSKVKKFPLKPNLLIFPIFLAVHTIPLPIYANYLLYVSRNHAASNAFHA